MSETTAPTPVQLTRVERLKSAVSEPIPFEVRLPDGEIKTFKLVLDYNALRKASEEVGRKLIDRRQWEGLSPDDITVIFWASFDQYHPEVTLVDARRFLAPTQIDGEVFWMLIENCFPGTVDMINKMNASKNGAGENGPNLPHD